MHQAVASVDDFEFVSAVDAQMWKDVEALFYFHPRQGELIGSIRSSVEAHGSPEILRRGGRIYVGIPKNDAQCLFACHPARRPGVPVGVVLYLRTAPELLRILHVAVAPPYELDGPLGQRQLALRLVNEVRALARRIKGVRRVQLPYCEGRFLPVLAGATP